VHASALTPAATDWNRIVELYEALAQIEPSPVIELNRAVALAMRDGPSAGLVLVDEILARGELADYHLAHAVRADLCRRLGQIVAARDSYKKALSLAKQDPERRFLTRRLEELG
jgi:RNA polymerase sigma-70 factor (ECF subfamily)